MAHVRSYSQRDKDGIFLYSNGKRIGGPYSSEEEATQASKLVSQMVGEAPVGDYQEFLKGPIKSKTFKGKPQYTPPERVSGTNLFGDLKKVGSSILDFVPEVLDKADSLIDFSFDYRTKAGLGNKINKVISKPFESLIKNPYKDPFMRKVFDDVLEDEGYRLLPYEDTGRKLTTGIGNLGYDPRDTKTGHFSDIRSSYDRAFTSPSEATDLTVKNIEEKIETAKRVLTPSVYDGLSESAKLAVKNMIFSGYLKKHHDTTKLIKQGRMKEAAVEFLDNDNYRDSKKAGTGIWKRFEKNARRLQM